MAVGTVLSSGSVSCVVPGRGAGFRALEVALSKSGEMSRSGMQVEYAGVGEVTSVQPASGVVAGGTVVTLAGSGFVAGRTACKFGSGHIGQDVRVRWCCNCAGGFATCGSRGGRKRAVCGGVWHV